MKKSLSQEQELFFREQVNLIYTNSRLKNSLYFIQHGTTSVCQHSIAVAYLSCCLAEKLRIPVDWYVLIRGALLHDYFLYDWHEKDPNHRLHGFTHPKKALKNAMLDFPLSSKEQNLILRHMFPLTPIPPICREGWIVCLADKLCSVWETARLTSSNYGQIQPKKILLKYSKT